MTGHHAIEVAGLVKRFGRFAAVDALDLAVRSGEVHGFLGPNGAGKSTTIRVLLGLYRANGGRVRVLGLDPGRQRAEITRHVSYVPGEVALWPNLTGQQVLVAPAGLRGARDVPAELRLIKEFALDTRKLVRTCSKGNRQKIVLIAAFAAPTSLLILDEPTSGLDPLMEELFKSCVRTATAAGRTVLLSSHILAEVEEVCQSVTIIKEGRLVESGRLADMSPRRLRDHRKAVGSAAGLALRLARRSILAWTVAVGSIGALFAGLGSGAVQQARQANLGGFLGTQLGTRDPVAGYFAYVGTVLALVVCAYTVLSVLGYRQNELAGRTDQILTTGRRRWTPLAAQAAVAALGSACVLLAAGTLIALIAPLVIDGPDVATQAFFSVVSQWPAALAVTGWTALLLGLRPQLAWLAWVPLITSGVLALLGQLLNIPQSVRNLGLFQHTPNIASAHTGTTDLLGFLVLVTVAALTCLAGLAAVTRRDVSAG